MSQSNKRALIMAGGTGGHVFPALAVAEELRARGFTLEWLGTAKGIESTLVPKANIPLNVISVEGVRGKGALGLLKARLVITKAISRREPLFAALIRMLLLALAVSPLALVVWLPGCWLSPW